MSKKNVKRKNRLEPLETWKIKYLLTGQKPELCLDSWEYCHTRSKKARKDWKENKEWLLRDFISKHAGKRPFFWWVCDSPEPRQRVGGIGTADRDTVYSFGVPTMYLSKWQEDYFNGRFKSKDPWMQGEYEKNGYKEGHFKGVAIDPQNPPTFESQSYYLKRHNLLTKLEEKRLKPKDFEPESCLKYVKNT